MNAAYVLIILFVLFITGFMIHVISKDSQEYDEYTTKCEARGGIVFKDHTRNGYKSHCVNPSFIVDME